MIIRKILSGILLLLSLITLGNMTQAQSSRVSYAADGNYAGAGKLGDIAHWKFNGDNPGSDLSGNNHTLSLRGKDSRFEKGALAIEEKSEPGDMRAGAVAANRPSLTPAGAFTIEIWFSPDAAALQRGLSFLVDKKFFHGGTTHPRSNWDYLLLLRKAGEKFILDARLGFGKDTSVAQSTPQTLEAGKTYHAIFSYNGEGKTEFYLDGKNIGRSEWAGRGTIAAGEHDLVIGDRVGSIGYRFLGRIFRVRLSRTALSFVSGQVVVEPLAGRLAFARMEQNAELNIRVTNETAAPIQNARVQLALPGTSPAYQALPALAAGQSAVVTFPLNTQLRPERYTGTISVVDATQKALSAVTPVQLIIAPRTLPHQMPVIMWGTTGDKSLQDLKSSGFTHQLVYPSNELWKWVWDNGVTDALPVASENKQRQLLDEMFGMGLGGVAYVAPGRWAGDYQPEYRRIDRGGKTYPRPNVDGQFPRVQEYVANAGKVIAKVYGGEPGLQGALVHTEVRDGTQLSFHEIDKKTYRDFSGEDIPANLHDPRNYNQKLYQEIPDFPASRVVPDNHPALKYLRWFWQKGDGWNALNTLTHDGLKSAGKGRFWTFSDPAVRAPGVYGNNGNVDYLSQWTYTYPDPLKIGLAGDELFAMAGGHAGQSVMNMTQVIWYRSQSTETPKPGTETLWEKTTPDAKFISIAPDHLSEALWIKLTRPVQGIAYHGWGSMGDKLGDHQTGYVTTNVETKKRLQSLMHSIVQPLAPTLLQIGDRKTDVAFLESFSSQMLAGRGTYGWGNGWGADSYLIANYAGLQPDIVYDETITQKGLDNYKILFLMHCDVLTQNVVEKIKAFQRNGGLVIGDEFLAPGIQPDIFLASVPRNSPDASKKIHLQKAAELKRQLNGHYQFQMESSNQEVIARSRFSGNAEYVFTINDHRTYGDYVGQHKKVMEKGLPAQSRITLNRGNGFVYDLMNRQEVKTQPRNGQLEFDVNLGGGEGNLFLITDKPAGDLQINSAAATARGQQTQVAIQLNDNTGQPLQAVVPLEVTIRDPQGRVAEQSGYYGAAGGKLALTLDIASNDAAGQWQIEVVERLRGQKITKNFLVQ